MTQLTDAEMIAHLKKLVAAGWPLYIDDRSPDLARLVDLAEIGKAAIEAYRTTWWDSDSGAAESRVEVLCENYLGREQG